MTNQYKTLKYACYSVNVSMSVVANLPPLLFITFRDLYNVSYTFLGLLILLNYLTQLAVDLVFSFFSHRFNIPKTVKIMPLLSFFGLLVYSVYPMMFPSTAYIGLVVGTIIFSASAGLGEVLISPIIATIPSKEPEREMSKLHSVYAWGVIPVVLITSLYLLVFDSSNWNYIVFVYMLVPAAAFFLFLKTDIPSMEAPEKLSGVIEFLKNKTVWLFVLAIFLGGAAECTMAQWASGYLEKALSIPKIWGDVFGVALFALMLAVGRSLYASYGKNINKVLLMCFVGATICYFTIALVDNPVVGLIACALTGLSTSMLWPGNLVVATTRFPQGGVALFALMAAGGDLGASIVPQFIGMITDYSINNPALIKISSQLSLLPEQFGMKLGLLIAALFPLSGILLCKFLFEDKKKK